MSNDRVVCHLLHLREEGAGMNIAVLGAGSLGSAIGGTLALAGNEVTLIGRTAHVEAINASGLTLIALKANSKREYKPSPAQKALNRQSS